MCDHLKQLMEAPKIYSSDDFKPMVSAVKPHWSAMPYLLKNKITGSYQHVALGDIVQKKVLPSSHTTVTPGAPLTEADETKAVEDAVKKLADSIFPSVSISEWDGEDPSFSEVLKEVFTNLEDAVQQVATGSGGDEEEKATEKMQDAAGQCAGCLED